MERNRTGGQKCPILFLVFLFNWLFGGCGRCACTLLVPACTIIGNIAKRIYLKKGETT